MPLKIVDHPEFTREVTVRVPVDGGYEDHKFTARFRLLDMDEMSSHNLMSPEGQTNFLQTVLVGADDIVDAKGNVMPWSDKLRDRLIAFVPTRNAIFDTYTVATTEARVGN